MQGQNEIVAAQKRQRSCFLIDHRLILHIHDGSNMVLSIANGLLNFKRCLFVPIKPFLIHFQIKWTLLTDTAAAPHLPCLFLPIVTTMESHSKGAQLKGEQDLTKQF